MNQILFGKKIKMGEAYLGETRRAVTQIELYPLSVARVLDESKTGYTAHVVAFGTPRTRVTASLAGQFKAVQPARYLREIPAEGDQAAGGTIAPAEILSVGSVCLVSGITKGKGRAGVVKLHGFAGGPRTHGQSDRLRRSGSIGQGTTPGRVYKGKKMAGRMGGHTATVKQAQIVSLDPATNTAWITGPVPGNRGTLLRLTVVGHTTLPAAVYISGQSPAAPSAPAAAAPSSAEEVQS